MADEPKKKPAKAAKPAAEGAAPKKEPKEAAPKPKAAAKKEAVPAPEAAPEPKKVKRPKAPRPKLAPAAERWAALVAAKVKRGSPPPRTSKRVKVTQIGSPIGREEYQTDTLKGLGLNKRHRSRVLEDTPAVRGMIARVQHLLRVETAS